MSCMEFDEVMEQSKILEPEENNIVVCRFLTVDLVSFIWR